MDNQYYEMDELTMDIPDSQTNEEIELDKEIEQKLREKYAEYLTV